MPNRSKTQSKSARSRDRNLGFIGFALLVTGLVFTLIFPDSQMIPISALAVGTALLVYVFARYMQLEDQLDYWKDSAESAQSDLTDTLRKSQKSLSDSQRLNILNKRIRSLVDSIHEINDIRGTLQKVLEVVIHETDANTGSLILFNQDESFSTAIFPQRHTRPDVTQTLASEVIENGVAGWILKHREPVIIADTYDDDRWMVMEDAPYQDRSVLAVPIIQEGVVRSIVTLIHHKVNKFTRLDMRLLTETAPYIATTLNNAEIFEDLQSIQAQHEALTKIVRQVGHQSDPAAVSKFIVETLDDLSDWDLWAILIYDPQAETVTLSSFSSTPFEMTAGKVWDLNQPEQDQLRAAFEVGKTQVFHSKELISALLCEECKVGSELFVPLQSDDQSLGAIYIADQEFFVFDQSGISLVEAIAEATTQTLLNARLLEANLTQRGRLEAVVEANKDGIILIDLQNQIRVINENLLRQVNLSGRAADWQGQPIQALYEKLRESSPGLVDHLEEVNQFPALTTNTPRMAEYTEGGGVLQVIHLPISSKYAEVGRVILIRDMTTVRELEKFRQDLISTMVHDLRNPLHIIGNGASVLRAYLGDREPLSPEESQLIRLIETNTQKMLNLVNSILDISRLERQELPITLEQFNMLNPVNELIELSRPLADEKSIELINRIDPHKNIIWADINLVSRVLQNLVGNAIKFSPHGAPIVFEAKEDPAAQEIVFTIEDRGPGIPEELQTTIFEKFVTGKVLGAGTGLGLAFCQMALEAMNGKIWIEESSPDGTTFAFSLPTVRVSRINRL